MPQPVCYAKRLNSPFTGVVQIVEAENARALSLDGYRWEIQYLHQAPKSFWGDKGNSSQTRRFARIARWNNETGLRTYPIDPRLNAESVRAECTPIIESLQTIKLPLLLMDHYEYWLLDEDEKKPLALLYTANDPAECEQAPRRPCWSAVPASQIGLDNTVDEAARSLPPVSYRLEQLVKKRAGQNPQANWYKRSANGDGALIREGQLTGSILSIRHFPPLLLREDWSDESQKSLCSRYLDRLSPRLLLLQNLSHQVRDQTEQRATAHALDVEHYYPLYTEVADKERMVSLRVEARLRRSIGDKLNSQQ